MQSIELKNVAQRALKGDKEALSELFSAGERLQSEGLFEDAAEVFKEAAVAYRVAGFRNKACAEDAISAKRRQILFSQLLVDWIEKNPSGFGRYPRAVSGLTERKIRELVDECRDELAVPLALMEAKLIKLGVELFSPNGGVESLVCWQLAGAFSGAEFSGVWSNTVLKVMLETAGDVVLEKFIGEQSRDD